VSVDTPCSPYQLRAGSVIAGADLNSPATIKKIPVSEIETCVACFRLSVSEEFCGGQRISVRHL
jgi:hypothetical protein